MSDDYLQILEEEDQERMRLQTDVMIQELRENLVTYKYTIPKKHKRRILTFN